jgi:hypothetical protein
MLYRFSEEEKPRKQKINKMNMDTKVVEDSEVEAHLNNWWSRTPQEAKELYDEIMAKKIPEDNPGLAGKETGDAEEQKEPMSFDDLHQQKDADGQPAPETPALDESGLPWDERINTEDKEKTKAGNWRQIPGLKKEFVDQVKSEIAPTTNQV